MYQKTTLKSVPPFGDHLPRGRWGHAAEGGGHGHRVLPETGVESAADSGAVGIHRKTVKRSLEKKGEYKPYDTGNRHVLLEPYRERVVSWLEEDDYSAVWMRDRLAAQAEQAQQVA